MDLKEAYGIIGVKEDVTLDELEDRFLLWIRKEKSQQDQAKNSLEETVDMKRITEAYNVIRDNLHQIEADRIKAESTEKPKSPGREKFDHYFYYYKYHVLAIIVVIVLAWTIISTIVGSIQENARIANLPPDDIHILMYGDYYSEDIEPLKETILKEFPEWEHVKVDLVYAPSEITSEVDIAATQKNQITLSTEEPDIYILDQHNFNVLSGLGPFLPIEIDDNLLAEIDPHLLKYVQSEDDDREYLYGIDIADSDIFNNLLIFGDEKIATLRFDVKNKENAIKFIEKAILGLE